MIVRKTREDIEYDFDTESKLFYNHQTGKWVKNPVNRYGLTKGKNIGKAIGKKVGLNPKTTEKMKFIYHKYQYLIPSGLKEEDIQILSDSLDLPVETIKLVTTVILYKNLLVKYILSHKDDLDNSKLEEMVNGNYGEVNSDDWYFFLGHDYAKILDKLIKADIIETDNKYQFFLNQPEKQGKCKWYKIKDSLVKGNETAYYKEEIKNDVIRLKFLNNSKKSIDWDSIDEKYHPLMKHAIELLNGIDTEYCRKYFKENIFLFYKITNPTEKGRNTQLRKILEKGTKPTVDEVFDYIEYIKQGNHYFNECDIFGERFHSVFTNMLSEIKKHIRFSDGSKGIDIDIKNSQMSFLNVIINEGDIVKKILPEFKKHINLLNSYKDKDDFKLFTKLTIRGKIYEYIQYKLNYKTRKQAKNAMFKIIFSNSKEYKKIKLKIRSIFPSFVYLCGLMNDKGSLIPKMCQRFESRFFIQGIALDFIKVSKFPFVTIHDGIIIHPSDLDNFNVIKNNILKKFEIDTKYFKFAETIF